MRPLARILTKCYNTSANYQLFGACVPRFGASLIQPTVFRHGFQEPFGAAAAPLTHDFASYLARCSFWAESEQQACSSVPTSPTTSRLPFSRFWARASGPVEVGSGSAERPVSTPDHRPGRAVLSVGSRDL